MSELVRLSHGLWVPEEVQVDLRDACMVLLGAAPANTYVAGLAAADVHGLWLPPVEIRPQLATATPGRVPRHMTRPRRGEVKTHRRMLRPDEVTTVDGLPIMTVARTWCDLATMVGFPDLVAAGDSALRKGVAFAELAEMASRFRNRPGARRIGEALPLLDARSRSRPESHLRVAVSGPDMPSFKVNEAVHDRHGGWLAEPDLAVDEAKIALEYQGSDHATVERMRKDITRGTDLRRDGWEVLLFGPAEVFRRPWQIKPEVRALIADRAPHLLPRRGPGTRA